MDRKRQHCRAVTSFPLMVKGKAWLGIKDPPAGEGQVGQKTPLWQRRDGVDRKNTSLAKKSRFLRKPAKEESRGGLKTSPGITLLFFDRKTKARLLSQETSPRTQVSTAAYHELDCVIIIIYEMCYIS